MSQLKIKKKPKKHKGGKAMLIPSIKNANVEDTDKLNITKDIIVTLSILCKTYENSFMSDQALAEQIHNEKLVSNLSSVYKHPTVAKCFVNKSYNALVSINANNPYHINNYTVKTLYIDMSNQTDLLSIIYGILFLSLYMYKDEDIKKAYTSRYDLIEDICVALFSDASTNKLLHCLLEDRTQPINVSMNITPTAFINMYKELGIQQVTLSKLKTANEEMNLIAKYYKHYRVRHGIIDTTYTLLNLVNNAKIDNYTGMFATVSDSRVPQDTVVMQQPTLIANIVKFTEASHIDWILYNEGGTYTSVKSIFSKLVEDVQPHNCLDPKNHFYNNCVKRRAEIPKIKTYSNDTVKEELSKGLVNMNTKLGTLLNIKKVPDDVFDLYQEELRKHNKHMVELEEKTAKIKSSLISIKTTLIISLTNLFDERRNYIKSIYNNPDLDKFIDTLYTEMSYVEIPTYASECKYIESVFKRDIEELTTLMTYYTQKLLNKE